MPLGTDSSLLLHHALPPGCATSPWARAMEPAARTEPLKPWPEHNFSKLLLSTGSQ